MYQGWSVQGILHFNESYDFVESNRSSCHSTFFNNSFLQYCIDKKNDSSKKYKKKVIIYEVCCHDLWTNDSASKTNDYSVLQQNERNDMGLETSIADSYNFEEEAETYEDNISFDGLKEFAAI